MKSILCAAVFALAAGTAPAQAGDAASAAAKGDERFQFERHGYFVTDRHDHSAAAPVFNKITGLKDSWAK